MILNKNPERDFYLEESYPLEWMYPQLSPHGLIFRLHPQPLDSLDPATIQKYNEPSARFFPNAAVMTSRGCSFSVGS